MTKSYEELLADMTGIIAKIYEKGYDKGYEQGKFDQRLEMTFEDVKRVVNERMDEIIEKGTNRYDNTFKKMAEETTQEKRDRIIEKAKKDIEELKEGGMYDIHPYACTAEYIVNKYKRTVVAIMRGRSTGRVLARGVAKAHPNDCFNVHIGKAIAVRRAMGLDVPDEYLNAPQPMVVRVGDMIRMKYYNPGGDRPDSYYVKIINSFDGDKIWYEGGGFDFRKDVDKDAKIIDDSREEATK